MAQTRHVELRAGECWADIAEAFMEWCLRDKKVARGGCHEGDAAVFADGRQYAAICIPDDSPDLLFLLSEWAGREGRTIR